MATPAGQAKAQALNSKIEGEARIVLDDIDRRYIRKHAREAHKCALNCYDKAGTTGSAEMLEQCARNCQMKHQMASNYVQQEVGQYQNRLNRAMQECQDKARDQMKPGYENDARQIDKVETVLLNCISKTVDQHIGLLKPMKERIVRELSKK